MFAKEGNTLSRFKLAIKKYHYPKEYDTKRTLYLNTLDIEAIRFTLSRIINILKRPSVLM
jgi:hypothetical protein